MSFDLQRVPCYDSTNCGEIFNCAPTTSIYSCSKPNPSIDIVQPKCPNNEAHLNCFGSDPNYCSGILQECNPNLGYYCKPNVSNPAQNYFSENLGCDVNTDPSCLEFENYSECQDTCWDTGGSEEVKNACEAQFTDETSCNSMKYFCKWNNVNKLCKEVDSDPWTLFLNNAPQNLGIPKTVFNETVNGYTLNCSQSSWSSTDITSYADTIRTCCISKPGTTKRCITTPRCQFVESTCDCGFKDINFSKNPSYNTNSSINDPNNVKNPWFNCGDTQQTLTVNGNSYLKKGYCTWCKGSQLKNFDYREWMINKQYLSQGEDIRSSDAWGTENSCTNRCSSYNKCENNKSEILWNECIWRNSKGAIGVDPNSENPDLTNGFCYSDNCLDIAVTLADKNKCMLLSNLKNICENELANTVSTKNQLYPVTPNSDIPTKLCTEGTTWQHSCGQTNGISHGENYTCGWCPNLQNDWPENPCTANQPGTSSVNSKWFDPLSVLGVKDQTTGTVAVVLIFILSLFFIIVFGFFCKWIWRKTHSK
jgi:hypothetical protein